MGVKREKEKHIQGVLDVDAGENTST